MHRTVHQKTAHQRAVLRRAAHQRTAHQKTAQRTAQIVDSSDVSPIAKRLWGFNIFIFNE